jgi:glycosyltransferase involved in cell wall biosynthesis
MPKVSVIVPCYNQTQYLNECLQSVLEQTYENWECIIVNDGSPDNTEEVALLWCKKDSRFKYLKKENGGLSSARNSGFELAKGAYVQFLDSDDYIHQNKLEDQISHLESDNSIDISYTNFFTFSGSLENTFKKYADCKIYNEPLNDFLFRWERGFSIPIHSAIFKKDLWDNEVPFNINLNSKEDWCMWIELMLKKAKISLLDKEYAFYRIHEKSMSRDDYDNLSSLIKLSVLMNTKLDNEIRDKFNDSIIVHIISLIKLKTQNQIIINNEKIKKSLSYRLGNTLIKPFHLIKKILSA